MKKILLTGACLLMAYLAFPCTTAVISGKYTKDGRPMIWKVRDTESFKNKMMFFKQGRIHFLGLVNSNDEKGEQVWGGTNSEGFSIMNSASFNVNMDDTTSFKDQEGFFMKEALATCKNLADFEKLLNKRKKPMGLAAHFGVIDADGGAAFYEVNNYTWTKFDANDAAQAPQGYVLRTNYSFTGKKDIGYGFIRFQTAQDMFALADAKGELSAQLILQDFSRSFKHSLIGKDYRKEFKGVPYGNNIINNGDFITRHGTSSNILIEGVKKGEAKGMSTLWTQVGYPHTCLTIPLWVDGGRNIPNVLLEDGTGNSPLNQYAMDLKDKVYPIERSSGYKYMNVSELINKEGTGITQLIEKEEVGIFEETKKHLKEWRQKSVNPSEIEKFYRWINVKVQDFYNSL